MYFRIVLSVLYWGSVGAFLHYTIPQTDIVRISSTYEKRVDFSRNAMFYGPVVIAADGTRQSRDIFFIQTFRANSNPMVYRNEDTGWSWPLFFKFNTANLQAEATDLVSTAGSETPQWVAVRHYGWRSELMSIFPNALNVKPVAGPDARVYPIWSWILWAVAALILWMIRTYWMRLREGYIDKIFDDIEDGFVFISRKIRGKSSTDV